MTIRLPTIILAVLGWAIIIGAILALTGCADTPTGPILGPLSTLPLGVFIPW